MNNKSYRKNIKNNSTTGSENKKLEKTIMSNIFYDHSYKQNKNRNNLDMDIDNSIYRNELTKESQCTKLCRFVKKNQDGNFGICHKEECSFAHSEESLKNQVCSFGNNCRRKNNCRFRHPDESRQAFYKRLGQEYPDMPKTDNFVRKPKVKNLGIMKKTSVSHPHKKLDISLLKTPVQNKLTNTPWAPSKVQKLRENCVDMVFEKSPYLIERKRKNEEESKLEQMKLLNIENEIQRNLDIYYDEYYYDNYYDKDLEYSNSECEEDSIPTV